MGHDWVSTIVILLSSVTLQWGVFASRRDAVKTVRIAMCLTLFLGFIFLMTQAIAWFEWNEAIQLLVERDEAAGLAVTGFHVLTGVHALHVLGGLVPLGFLTIAILLGAWQAGRARGIHYTAMYWHFLGAVWLALVITLVLVL